jgi:hypothetical protein
MAQKANVISRIRQVGTDFLKVLEQIQAELQENTSNGFVYADQDFVGSNVDLTAAQFSNLLNTLNTVNTAVTAAHRTNLYLARNN